MYKCSVHSKREVGDLVKEQEGSGGSGDEGLDTHHSEVVACN